MTCDPPAHATSAWRQTTTRCRTPAVAARRLPTLASSTRCRTESVTAPCCRASRRECGRALRRASMQVQPVEHRRIPEDAVGGLEHPVILVGKFDEAALDATPLQRR